jgi:hypothetical protein
VQASPGVELQRGGSVPGKVWPSITVKACIPPPPPPLNTHTLPIPEGEAGAWRRRAEHRRGGGVAL